MAAAVNTRTEQAIDRLIVAVDDVLSATTKVADTVALRRARANVIRAQAIEDATRGLRMSGVTGIVACKVGNRQRGTFARGWEAAIEGRERESCEYTITRGGFRDAWLRGWDRGERDLRALLTRKRRR